MKKLLLFTSIMVLCSVSANGGIVMMGGGGATPAASACAPGYNTSGVLFSTDFDHTTGSTYACANNGTAYDKSADDGTYEIASDYGNSGNGFRITAVDEYVTWANNFSFAPNSAGTIWLGIRQDTDNGSYDSVLFELVENASSANSLKLRQKDGNYLQAYWTGNGTEDNAEGNDAITEDTWTRVAVSWQFVTGTDFCVQVNGLGWDCEDDDLVAFATTAALTFTIGENILGNSTDTIWIDDVYVMTGYQTADPHGAY